MVDIIITEPRQFMTTGGLSRSEGLPLDIAPLIA